MNTQPLTSEGIIYYPTIEFQNDGWLKSALTIWERVYRIVPNTYTPKDSEEVRRAVDAGLVEDIRLTDHDKAITADQFLQFWKSQHAIPKGFQHSSRRFVRIHTEKMDQRVQQFFEDLGNRIASDRFIQLNSVVASAYMFWLTERVSRSRNLPKLSDDPDRFTVMQYFVHDAHVWSTQRYIQPKGYFQSNNDEYAAALILETIIPQGIEHASIDSVIKFRQKHGESRAAFRTTIRAFIDELAKVTDSTMTRDMLNDFQNKLRVNRESYFESIKKSDWTPRRLLVSIGVPICGTILSSLSQDARLKENAIVSSIAVALTEIATTVNSRRLAWKGSEASYYFDLEHKFGEPSSTRMSNYDYGQSMYEFLHD